MHLGHDLDRKEGARARTYLEDRKHKQYIPEFLIKKNCSPSSC